MKNTISDKTEIFDPKIDFGEWCQQDGVIGSPTSHSSTETMTLTLKHLEEKFSIQLRSRLWRSPNWEPSNFSGWKELLHILPDSPCLNSALFWEKVPLWWDLWGTWDFGLSSWPLGASCMRPGSTSPYLESWVTCTPGHHSHGQGGTKGREENSPTAKHGSVRLGIGTEQRLFFFSYS